MPPPLQNFGSSLARERIEERAEQDRLEKMNTKQKAGTPLRDIKLQHRVLHWMIGLLGEKPKGKVDYDNWIQDPALLVRVLQTCMYNSVPMDMIEGPVSKVEKREDKLELFLNYSRRFGVPEKYLFDPEIDLTLKQNIPKVTRCLASLAKLARFEEFEDVNIEEEESEGEDDDERIEQEKREGDKRTADFEIVKSNKYNIT
ncbi:uncharacterized protein LOC111716380 [Eurytemora carolleeae]|uniref:uncharacterized protein LOC111716380 n=1 Tax=Eurytemora carolleeae TaxID=1294199 RepID=UPI000C790688|nr:uncharacterized protein LOC111716380 [Eurytemora carolleeae]|eukprot:XP_023347598.1 uncharacterized protein LOC111716380 [Eurytemora affinis]